MSEAYADPPPTPANKPRLDTTLTIVIAVLAAGILALGAWFGYSVWADAQRTEMTNAPSRVAAALERQVKASPNDEVLRVRLGEAYASAGRYEQAVEQFNEALKLNPEHIGAHLDLGMVAMLTNTYDKAEAYFVKVVELTEVADFTDVDERRETALYNLGLLKLDQKEYQKAAGYFKEALRIRKDAADTYVSLARALRGMGEYDAALENLNTALAFDPSFAEAHYTMGEIYRKQGNQVSASYHFMQAAKLAPEAAEPKEAVAAFGPASDWIARAETARAAGDLDAAHDAVLVARNLDPNSIEAAKLHGAILIEREEYKDAVIVFLQVRDIDSADSEVEAQLSALERDHRKQALAAYRAELKKDADNEFLKERIAALD